MGKLRVLDCLAALDLLIDKGQLLVVRALIAVLVAFGSSDWTRERPGVLAHVTFSLVLEEDRLLVAWVLGACGLVITALAPFNTV